MLYESAAIIFGFFSTSRKCMDQLPIWFMAPLCTLYDVAMENKSIVEKAGIVEVMREIALSIQKEEK